MSAKVCFLIDDDMEDCELFELALKESRPEILFSCLNDSPNAVKILSSGDFIPNYIFMDINMPKMNGWECLQAIGELPHLSGVPIAFFSTGAQTVPRHQRLSKMIKKQNSIGALVLIFDSYFRDLSEC